MASATAHNILSFHKSEGEAYEQVRSLGRDPTTAKNIVALWMWLEIMGFNDLINRFKGAAGDIALRFVREAEAILDSLRQGNPPSADVPQSLPLTGSLVTEPISLRFFYTHRDVAIRSIVRVLDGVGRVIFDDVLRQAASNSDAGRYVPIVMRNLLAAPYVPAAEPTPEDRRSMFVTFPMGHPLGSKEITTYLTGRWGECVERVIIEQGEMYGRVIFASPSFILLVFNGAPDVEFNVNGKQMWGRIYVAP